jgi:hypothetical protein
MVYIVFLVWLTFTAPAAMATEPAADPAISFAANDVAFLNLMGNLEGPYGFDTVSGFAPAAPERPLTQMTLSEVIAYQEKIRSLGTISSAVGRYQFIYRTLHDLVHRHGISGDLVFDGEVQTYLARFLMHNCGFYTKETPVVTLANCLATVWAALPVVSGPGTGKSFYQDDGINAALTTPATVLDVLERRFQW